MKDLMRLVNICKSDLDNLGIKYGRVGNWTINTRAKCRLGQCKKVGFGLFDINISALVLEDNIDDQVALDTIMHELLHTVYGCLNHGVRWKAHAELVNRRFTQYNVTRVADYGKLGIKVERRQPNYKYVLRCTACGQEIKRQKESKVIINYKKYRCGKCGGRLERML